MANFLAVICMIWASCQYRHQLLLDSTAHAQSAGNFAPPATSTDLSRSLPHHLHPTSSLLRHNSGRGQRRQGSSPSAWYLRGASNSFKIYHVITVDVPWQAAHQPGTVLLPALDTLDAADHAAQLVQSAPLPCATPVPSVAVRALQAAMAVQAAQVVPEPETLLLPAAALVAMRQGLAEGDPRVTEPLQHFLQRAESLLTVRPLSVMDKPPVPSMSRGGGSVVDMHDYYSIGLYRWPNPNTTDGLPWTSRDCQVNPNNRNGTDSAHFNHTLHVVEILGFAYYVTGGDERYAAKAVQLVDVWFLDSATRMNPNLNHAQGTPGHRDGSSHGVIEARHLVHMCDALSLLNGSRAWTAAKQAALKKWLGEYYKWLRTSRFGQEERGHKNNHGSWYDFQSVGLALALGKMQDAKQVLAEVLTTRIAVQIEPDGRQSLELARPDPDHYVHFNFEALEGLATLGRHAGVDLWALATPDGRSLCGARRHLKHPADPSKPSPKHVCALCKLARHILVDVVITTCIERLGLVAPDPCMQYGSGVSAQPFNSSTLPSRTSRT